MANLLTKATDVNNNEEMLLNDTTDNVVHNYQDKLQNMKSEDMVRGSTPKNIDVRCLDLCRSFIGGCWSEARGTGDITVKRISGGFTNQLYHVRLNEVTHTASGEPTEVAIKFYQAKHMKNYHADDSERLNDTVILTIVSHLGIGPKVYGIFEDGFIQAFIKHEQFRKKHQENPKLLRECALLQAKIHHLNVPIRKDSTWLLRIIREWIEFAYEKLQVRHFVEQFDLDAFKCRDLLEELVDFERYYGEANSPPAFSHIDFRGSNILVEDSSDSSLESQVKLSVVDMEHCAFAPRAFDMATFLTEWGKELFDFENLGMPEDAVIEHYVNLYVEACTQLVPGYADKPENRPELIFREVKFFILVNIMFFIALSIKQEESVIIAVPFNPLIKMTYINKVYRVYQETKKRLIEDGTILQ